MKTKPRSVSLPVHLRPKSWSEKSYKPFKTRGHETIREGEGAEESIVFVLPKELRREGEKQAILNKGKFVICFI